MLFVDVGLFGLLNVGKFMFICSVLVVKLKVVDYLFMMLIFNLGVVCFDVNKLFVIVDILGFIEGVLEGVGFGICFLKYLECCCVLLYIIDIMLVDGINFVDNVFVIINELY